MAYYEKPDPETASNDVGKSTDYDDEDDDSYHLNLENLSSDAEQSPRVSRKFVHISNMRISVVSRVQFLYKKY